MAGQNEFETPNLTPGATYQIRVRDCDAITCTPWSNWLIATMAGKGSDGVQLYLESGSQANQIGSATLGGDGTFSALVTIPSTTSPGNYTLQASVGGASQSAVSPVHLATHTNSTGTIANALGAAGGGTPAPRPRVGTGAGTHLLDSNAFSTVSQSVLPLLGGQTASAAITVCSATSCQPRLEVVDPTTHSAVSTVMEGDQLTVRGSGFAPGTVLIYLDSASSRVLAGAGVGSDGTFTGQLVIPRGAAGNHTLLAADTHGRTEATDKLFIEQIPR
jgi:hypothetical protein